MSSNSNRGVVYLKPGSVEVQKIDFPTFRNPAGKAIDHGVILKVVTTNICGSATSYRSLSTSHAAAAGPVEMATPASAFTSIPSAPGAPMDMSIWADGSAGRPTT